MLARLFEVLKVKPEETSMVSLLLLYSFFSGIGLVLLDSGSSAIFLTERSSDELRYVYLIAAVVTVGLGAVYTKLESRLSPGALLSSIETFLSVALFAFAGVLYLSNHVTLLYGLLAWREAHFALAAVQFGVLSGLLFDLRQSKRLMGLVASGDIVAGILGGIGVALVVAKVGARGSILIAGVSQLISLGILRVLLVRNRSTFYGSSEAAEAEEEIGPVEITKKERPFVFSLYLAAVTGTIVFYLLDFAFYDQVSKVFPEEEELMSFFGYFFTILGVAKLFTNTVLTGPAFARFGIAFGLISPSFVLLSSLTLALGAYLVYGLGTEVAWVFIAMKLLDGLIRTAFQYPASQTLYQPLRDELRLRIQSITETIAHPTATGVAGVGLIAIGFSRLPLIPTVGSLLFVGSLISLAVAIRQSKLYQGQLVEALNKRQLVASDLNLEDPKSFGVIQHRIASGKVADVIFCLSLLAKGEIEKHLPLIHEQLHHPNQEVRRYALAIVEQYKLPLRETLIEIAQDDPIAEVRSKAVAALAAVYEEDSIELVEPYLESTDLEVVIGSIVALLKFAGIDGVLTVGPRLKQLEKSESPKDRLAVAQILSRAEISDFYRPLVKLLEDPAPEVRLGAIEAAGSLANPKLTEALLEKLVQPSMGQAALNGLVAIGTSAVPSLRASMAATEPGSIEFLRHFQALSKIGGASAEAALFDSLDVANPLQREKVLDLYLDVLLPLGLEREGFIHQSIEAELEAQVLFQSFVDAFGQSENFADTPLGTALTSDLGSTAMRVLVLNRYQAPKQEYKRAIDKIARGRADATTLELVDLSLPPRWRKQVLGWVEGQLPKPSGGGPFDPESKVELLRRCRRVLSEWTIGLALRNMTEAKEPVPETELEAWTHFGSRLCLEEVTQNWIQSHPGKDPFAHPPFRGLESKLHRFDYSEQEGAKTMAMLTIERVIALKSVGIFSGLPEKLLVPMAEICKERLYATGEKIISQGESGNSMFVIIEGTVRVLQGQKEVARIESPTVVGELAALDPEPRSADILAVSDVVAFEISAGPLYEVIADHAEIANDIIRFLCQRIRAK